MIVEDGSIVPNADSLVDEAFADAYFEARGIFSWDASPDKEAALVLGTSWVLNKYRGSWRGSIVDSTQPLAWPRKSVVDADGRLLPSDEIPLQIKHAVCEAALRFGQGTDLNVDPAMTGAVKRRRDRVEGAVDREIEYFEGAGTIRPTVPIVDELLSGLTFSANQKLLYRM